MINRFLFPFFGLALFVACSDYTPRPRGYFRIDFPEKTTYNKEWQNDCAYGFDVSDEVVVRPHLTNQGKCWIDIVYPFYKGQIYCSYKEIHGNFHEVAEDTRMFVYKHTIKADDILEKFYENPERHVYGILYDLKGNTASPIQFVLTDSTTFLFRGALYFDSTPNKDSIAPVVDFVRKDIIRLMESFEKQ